MASTDVMEVAQSLPLSWEDRVQEEEDKQERHSSVGDSQPCLSPVRMEGCSISDISMAEEGPQQGDSDVVVEEEVEESMEMDEPFNVDAPTPLLDGAFLKGSEAEAEDDHQQSHIGGKYGPKPCPMTRTSMRMSFWGCRLTFPYLGGTLMTP